MPSVILVDVMSAVFRAHYAHKYLTSEKRSTGVLYGIVKSISDLQKNVSREMIFCWDHGVPILGAERPRNWRETISPEYKATRKRDNDDWPKIVQQLPILFHIINLLGYSNVAVWGLEADDVIGIISKELTQEVLIFSNDQDFYQLLDTNTHVLVPKKERGGFSYINAKNAELETEVSPMRWAEYLALGGDSCDNIKPQRGMGPKTALKLLQGGIDLRENKTFKQQTPAFQSLYAKYEPVWDKILAAYHAAQIPTNRQDPRLHTIEDMSGLVYTPEQNWPNEETRIVAKRAFEKFCAEYEMATLLNLRHQLFDSTGETACPPPTKRKTLRPLPRRRTGLLEI